MMKTWRVWLVIRKHSCWSQNKPEVSIEILDVRFTRDAELVLAEAQHFKHHSVIEVFGLAKIRHRYVDMVDSNDFSHLVLQLCK